MGKKTGRIMKAKKKANKVKLHIHIYFNVIKY